MSPRSDGRSFRPGWSGQSPHACDVNCLLCNWLTCFRGRSIDCRVDHQYRDWPPLGLDLLSSVRRLGRRIARSMFRIFQTFTPTIDIARSAWVSPGRHRTTRRRTRSPPLTGATHFLGSGRSRPTRTRAASSSPIPSSPPTPARHRPERRIRAASAQRTGARRECRPHRCPGGWQTEDLRQPGMEPRPGFVPARIPGPDGGRTVTERIDQGVQPEFLSLTPVADQLSRVAGFRVPRGRNRGIGSLPAVPEASSGVLVRMQRTGQDTRSKNRASDRLPELPRVRINACQSRTAERYQRLELTDATPVPSRPS